MSKCEAHFLRKETTFFFILKLCGNNIFSQAPNSQWSNHVLLFFLFSQKQDLTLETVVSRRYSFKFKTNLGLFALCIRNYRPSNIDAEFCYWYQESLRDTIVVVLWNHSILTTLASDVWTWMFVDVTQITRRFYKRKTCDRRKPVGSLERLVYFYAIMSVGGRRMEYYSLVGERKKELFTRKLLTFFWNFLTVAKKMERVGNLTTRWRWRIVFVRKRRGRRWKGGKMYHSGLKMLFFFSSSFDVCLG